MKGLVLGTLFIMSFSLIAATDCEIDNANSGIGIYANGITQSLVPTVPRDNLKKIMKLTVKLEQMLESGLCQNIQGYPCRLSKSNGGHTGIYYTDSRLPLAITSFWSDMSELSEVAEKFLELGVCTEIN